MEQKLQAAFSKYSGHGAIIPPPVVPPTPAEIRALHERLGMSIRAFSALLGVNPRTLTYWLSGERTPDTTSSRLLRLIEKKPLLLLEF